MLRAILLLTVSLVAVPSSAVAQARTDDPIRELLSEVRLLRQALERAATTGTRIQLLVARVQLQEQRVGDLSRRLDGARSELRDLERVLAPTGQEVESFEEKAAQSTDPQERRGAEQHAARMKVQLAGMERRRQELTNDDAMLSQQLSTEQNRLADFNERLEQLEQSLIVREKR
jgi:chromosome segregation ATPase